ncbi:MAG: DUF4070 domain-containing protein [Chloroflexota bacterium]|nr:DUF4070 domain-containing protein [Chloroflexota bacterium]
MKVLLLYPRYPDTFWSFRHVLKVVSKKAAFPPLGAATVAAMLPDTWEKRLIDLNVSPLTDEDIRWADYVFISAMVVQRESARDIIKRCKRLETKIVAGGPLFTSEHDEFDDVDHLVLDEAEITLPLFLADLEKGDVQHIYTSKERPDIKKTPLPMWSIVDMKKYTTMSIQYSRGCPYNCEFCDIVVLNGHTPRTKSKEQILAELDALYDRGWRAGVFIVDDNFIGNKRKLKQEILPAMIEWQKRRKHPFTFLTEASINLADDDDLMQSMVRAGFDTVFIGIETINEESLAECSKQQNIERDMVASVKKMQNHGFQVQGGFILGFDSDPISIFKSQINFIQNSGIVTAMVGLLNAPRDTRLYHRLKKENRLLENPTGDNTDCTMNFIPKMDRDVLINGYQQILTTIYSPKQFYKRILVFLKEYNPQYKKRTFPIKLGQVRALFRVMWLLGIRNKGRGHYWKFFFSTLLRYPRSFPLSMTLAVYGFHFRTVVYQCVGTSTEEASA